MRSFALERPRENFHKFGKVQSEAKLQEMRFCVKSGKFLGFMRSERGIEVNPQKIEAIARLLKPRCIKNVQRLHGCITALGRFIFKSAERCLPLFKALKASKANFKWTEECSQAWKDMKNQLSKLPLLGSPNIGETMFLYLSFSDLVVASILIKEVESKQHPVYFVSKALNDAESRYSNIEKLAYSLVISSRKLKAYFESHPILIYINVPLRQVFHKMDQSDRMLRWSIKLCGQDITFMPRTTIKVQALTDFLVEGSFTEENIGRFEPTVDPWTMIVVE